MTGDRPDRIELRGLTVRGNHGVFDFEKREGQDFVIDVTLHTSVNRAAATDDIADTVHYGELAEDVAHIVEDNTFDLIETLASRIAEHCLGLAEHVEVIVHKPGAPIQRSFSDVSVTVVRSRAASNGTPRAGIVDAKPAESEAYLNLGANLGDAADTLDQAVAALDLHPRISVLRRSSLYRTAPWGGVEQNDFLNLGLIVSTRLPARELLAVAQGIEVASGRTREVRWGPRSLDIDLIRFLSDHEELVLDTEVLTLPHPRAHERAFVLAPWAELDADAAIDTPAGRQSIATVLAQLGDQEITRIPAP
ncbi:MAG: 2-amino-4-hydroxy-6-hydroxymethyldihydropteridine diphosphokinase [Brevibacterium sp.]|uniref:2-amino-4-hydroxy-6- hydroxymethyldihydropteridine diphosphokinase n=1 Tax=Brevibacterium sp. TaxID=1701 RepID=UPI0026475872|nr:2-amino-4-hydroxy-6-hydroxymethyldihydropteridine diphosphokinase [Brevibacterium sp.]MDN5806608.1 2-amino-4-hydroxy-6-hydroxymethyldihydropteridine diphosphokinase [Brevibacterium sp.]MDN5833714.1 2-amino-4-hydroxy-6-hydroxymethyldihydropteridine diphosphokinase [Brevibacterium sp.]MDN5875967.1 2-amino-4-hydroxy-6-hydroxymethyldihydropteridine diphosphokinase [Brevibacterium sp.]MDN5909514.1 2-amino-4-hydroxy-6-hydroxymethyldihydropteridine diphosphokinase [Brevibacterium sp.]MDN6122789.1 